MCSGLVNGPDSLMSEFFQEAGSTGQNMQGLANIIHMFSFKFHWPQRISGGPQSTWRVNRKSRESVVDLYS